jgi:hypothetical protein
MLPPASDEQLLVIDSIVSDDCNVKLTSVAGSGKTTLSLHCISRIQSMTSSACCKSKRRALLLTYNSNLKRETRRRVVSLGLAEDLVEVHSFHSFGKHYYCDSCRTDEALDDMVSLFSMQGEDTTQQEKRKKSPSLRKCIEFDLLIVDESQDVCPLYWDVIMLIARLNIRGVPQFLLIGDPRQSIYEYKGADPRYLTHCDEIMPKEFSSVRRWRSHTLSTTWRLSVENANFVNSVFLRGEGVLVAGNPIITGHLPKVFVCNAFKNTPANVVFDLLTRHKPEDIMILAPSVKKGSKTPLRILEKILLECSVPVNVNDAFEDCSLSEEVMRGKLVLMTFHGSKGAERDAVIVIGGTDENYPKFFQRNISKDGEECPNPVYVSMTRARKELVIIHHNTVPFAPYVDERMLQEYALMDGSLTPQKMADKESDGGEDIKRTPDVARACGVLDILAHMPFDKIKSACNLLKFEERVLLDTDFPRPKLVTSVRTKWGASKDAKHEYVADLNGIAIPAILEYQYTGSTWLFSTLPLLKNIAMSDFCSDIRAQVLARVREAPSVLQASDFLAAATLHQSSRSQYFYRAKQINNYRWLDAKDVKASLAILRESGIRKDTNPVFEVQLGPKWLSDPNGTTTKRMAGVADVVTNDAIYEIKCTGGDVQNIHILQLVMYAWMLGDATKKLRLVYVTSGKVVEVEYDQVVFDMIIERIAMDTI